jgi:hypothetical protein
MISGAVLLVHHHVEFPNQASLAQVAGFVVWTSLLMVATVFDHFPAFTTFDFGHRVLPTPVEDLKTGRTPGPYPGDAGGEAHDGHLTGSSQSASTIVGAGAAWPLTKPAPH